MEPVASTDQLTARPGRPAAMAPFDEAARQIAEGRWPEALAAGERPFVAVVCNLALLELIHAAGAVPVRLCAGEVGEHPPAGREAPRDMCQVVKGAAERLEAFRAQAGNEPVAVVVPGTCDWKTRCCGFLGLDENAWTLEVPRDKEPRRARRDWRRQIARLAESLAERTGSPITRRSLLDAVKVYQRAAWLGRRLADCMKQPVPPLAGADLMLAFNLFYSLPVETWIEWAFALLEELEAGPAGGETEAGTEELEAHPAGGETEANREESETDRARPAIQNPKSKIQNPKSPPPRLLVVGAPIIWPNWWLPRLIESAGGTIVADALCSSYRGFSDLVSVDESGRGGLMEAVADRYLLPCTCPCFSPNEEYIWRLETLANDFRIDGAVIHRLKNCYLFDMEAKRLEELFARLGVAALEVESDYESPTAAALKTRVEAFIELLREKT